MVSVFSSPFVNFLLTWVKDGGRVRHQLDKGEIMTNRQRAKMVVAQLIAGEWVFRWNPLAREALTASRNGLELWCGNGSFFVEIRGGGKSFGLIWRHYVWWAALRRIKSDFDKAHIKNVDNLLCTRDEK